jgi:nucleoside-diphosphate-sugar epimerase
MRVFMAGATGVIGRSLVPMLLAEGHRVTAMTSSPGKVEQLRAIGAEPVLADALDEAAVFAAVRESRPDAVIHRLTALPSGGDASGAEPDFELNDRLRKALGMSWTAQGVRILVDAAKAAGATRMIAQSIAFFYDPGPPGTVHREGDPLLRDPPKPVRCSAQAIAELERTVLDAGGVVLRYGYFYGPGSATSTTGAMGLQASRRRLPIVGRGQGVWSFVHVDDAARATVAALTRGGAGAYNVVDDDPAPVSQWLPAFAQALGAPRPRRLPALVARPVAGSYGVAMMTRAEGAANDLAKRELGWTPRYPSWREGFRSGLS